MNWVFESNRLGECNVLSDECGVCLGLSFRFEER